MMMLFDFFSFSLYVPVLYLIPLLQLAGLDLNSSDNQSGGASTTSSK